MRASRPFLVLAAAIALVAPPLFAQQEHVEFEGRLWQPNLTGLIQTGDGVAGTAIDPLADLGLADDEGVAGRFTWRLGKRNRIRLAWLNFGFSGDSVVSRTVVFGGTAFNVQTRVLSDLDLEYARLSWIWQVLYLADGRFRLGPILEVKGFRGDARLRAPDLPLPTVEESGRLEAAYGAAGLALDIVPHPKLHLVAEITELVESGAGELRDTDAGIRFYLHPVVGLYAGHRRLELGVREGADLLDLVFEGPYFGASLRF